MATRRRTIVLSTPTGVAGRAARAADMAMTLSPAAWASLLPRLPMEFRISVRRPDDLLVLDLIFENLRLETGPSPRLVRTTPSATGILIAEFPPQSFAEEAFMERSEIDDPTDSEIADEVANDRPPRVRMSGRSRIAVSMPAAVSHLDYTLTGVLAALREWPMRLALTAAPEPPARTWLAERGFGVAPDLLESLTALPTRTWLRSVTSGTVWRNARDGARAALHAVGGEALQRMVDGAALRVAELAAAGDAEAHARRMDASIAGELQRITHAFPQVAHTTGREVLVAALSIGASDALSNVAVAVDSGLAITDFPLLSLLLRPREPHHTFTALEVPYRVILSPLHPARWRHRDEPATRNARTELWHTRLTTSTAPKGPDRASRVRAIWSPDYPLSPDAVALASDNTLPFRSSLDPMDRQMLVKLMAGFDEPRQGKKYVPRGSDAKRLHLSALGALLDAEGQWLVRPDNVDLEQWRHLASLGRDHFVRVVYVGYLCPWGHAAALIKVTERKFETVGTGSSRRRTAPLRQRYFIVVRERVRQFNGAEHEFGGRNFPFTEVEILTRVTPNLLPPTDNATRLAQGSGPAIYAGGTARRMVFWPMLPKASANATPRDFLFDVAATDLAGERVTFSMPLLFMSEVPNADAAKVAIIRDAYNAPSAAPRRSAPISAKSVCFAPIAQGTGDNGDTRLPTSSMTFAMGKPRVGIHHPLKPNFHPETESATVGLRAVQRLLNRPHATVTVSYPSVYRSHGFGGPNSGQLYLINQAHELGFGDGGSDAKTDALGAIAAPQMAIQGLSRAIGPVSGLVPSAPGNMAQVEQALGKAVSGSFDPADFLQGAKILGGVDLADILSVVSLLGADVPKMISRELPDRVEAGFDWETPITKSDPLNLIIPRADQSKPQTVLAMHSLVTTPLTDPTAATSHASGELNNFKVNLFGFVIIWFERLRFVVNPGQKPDVTVDLRHGNDAIQFGGPLEFVNKLRELIPANGFSDPPDLMVTPSGIAASFSLTLPAVEVGVLSLSNLSLGAGFNLPFDSKPASVQFNFSTRESPFSLTVSMLGGGGFFMLGVSSKGVNEIEAALEFGAAVAINLGVASGRVEIKAGIYFHWLADTGDGGLVELTGYIRLHGELRVLGLISASLTFNLQLSYLKKGSSSTLVGEATLVVEISLLIFSASVSVKCRREFGGSDADPKFLDLMPNESLWTQYCDAFAEEVA